MRIMYRLGIIKQRRLHKSKKKKGKEKRTTSTSPNFLITRIDLLFGFCLQFFVTFVVHSCWAKLLTCSVLALNRRVN